MRLFRVVVSAATLCFLPAAALAETCPDGDWFCEGTSPESAAEGSEPPPTADEGAAQPSEATPPKEGPPVVVYTPKGAPKPSRVIVVEEAPPKPPRRRQVREWGFNLHLSGALMGDDPKRAEDAGMGGVGFSIRYRPVRVFALDVGLELLDGTDWNGFERSESALLANAMLFFNARDKLQVYWFGGFAGSRARVYVEEESATFEEQYGYFGVQTGFGLEARVSKRLAIAADLLGFVRGRTDVRQNTRPEFVDPETHQATNASGGGLIRGGVTFYW